MSNRTRLVEAGLIDRRLTLTPVEYEAIDSLTEEEVDHLISVNQKLAYIESNDTVIEMPGRNPPPGESQSS